MGIGDNSPQQGYCVYAHINKSNGKIYIGISKNVKQRWAGKIHAYKQSTIIYNAFKKYGWNGFYHVVLWDKMSKEEASKIEQAMIYLFKFTGKSYNITDGGEGRLGVARTEKQKQSAREKMLGRKATKETRERMSKAQSGMIRPWKHREVFAFDKQTGEFIKRYNSISTAAQELKLSPTGISNAARGKCPSMGGFIWSFTPYIDINDARYKMMEDLKVYCYSKEGNLINVFDNTREAANFVDGIINCISDNCSGRTKTYKGYIWRKAYKSKEEILNEYNNWRKKQCA